MEICNVVGLSDEGLRLRFYVPYFNKREWGMVYAMFYYGDKRHRQTTAIKVKREHWNVKRGCVEIEQTPNKVETLLHETAKEKLRKINTVVDSLIYDYLCSETPQPIESVVESVSKLINPCKTMGKKKHTPQSMLSAFRGVILENTQNEKSQRSLLGIVGNFERFLRESKIADEFSNLNMATMRQYREWLVNISDVGANRANQCLQRIFSFATTLERKHGMNFNLNKNHIEPIKDLRTRADRLGNSIALTHEEIEKIASLNLDGKKEIVRDLFLIQCYGGCRWEDINKLLDSANLKVVKGNRYSIFTTEKKGVDSHVPLDSRHLYPKLWGLWNKYKDYKYEGSLESYNKYLQQVAQLANLDREVRETHTRKGQKVVEVRKVYEAITSHDGRHTFITNCQRYLNMSPENIIYISGHTDTKMIETIYTNMETEDKISKLATALNESKKTNEANEANEGNVLNVSNDKPNRSNNYLIDGISEGRSVLRFLGIKANENLSFEQIVSMIEDCQQLLINDFGVDILSLKHIFNVTAPLDLRIRMLSMLLRELRGKK